MDATATTESSVATTRNRTATVQMNTRIDRDLKREGDAVLERAGLTPTEAVRCLYELALRYRDRPRALRELLAPRPQEELDAEAAERARKLALIEEGSTMCQRYYDERGITPDNRIASLPYDQLRELALLDEYGMLEESGLLEELGLLDEDETADRDKASDQAEEMMPA